MAGKTQGDRLLELERIVTTLGVHVETFREQIGVLPELGARITAMDERFKDLRLNVGRVETGFGEVDVRIRNVEKTSSGLEPADLASLRERIKELEVKIGHLEKQRGEEHGRAWAIKLAVLSALMGSGFTILTQFLSRYLPLK